MRASRGGEPSRIVGRGVGRAVVDDHELVREARERGRDAAAELGASPSSLSIGATTLSRRSSRADMAAGV